MKVVSVAVILACSFVPTVLSATVEVIRWDAPSCDGDPSWVEEETGQCIDDNLENDDSHHMWSCSGRTVTIKYFPGPGCGTHDKMETFDIQKCYPDREKGNAYMYKLGDGGCENGGTTDPGEYSCGQIQ